MLFKLVFFLIRRKFSKNVSLKNLNFCLQWVAAIRRTRAYHRLGRSARRTRATWARHCPPWARPGRRRRSAQVTAATPPTEVRRPRAATGKYPQAFSLSDTILASFILFSLVPTNRNKNFWAARVSNTEHKFNHLYFSCSAKTFPDRESYKLK